MASDRALAYQNAQTENGAVCGQSLARKSGYH